MPGPVSSAGRLGPVRYRPRGSRPFTVLRWTVLISVLLHLVALVVVELAEPEPPVARNNGEPESVEVVMLPPGAPEAAPAPVPEPNPTTPETPAPPVAPTLAVPAKPLPTPPEPPPVRLALPVPPLPPMPEPEEVQEEALPTPPPLPRARPRPAPSFPHPIARSLADLTPTETTPAPPPPPRPQPGRGFDLALGPVARASKGAVPRNPDGAGDMVRVEGADLGADWLHQLHEWWERHGYYPRQAAEQGQDGTTRLRVRVDRSGRVHEVTLEMRSGSQWLDMGSLAIFRDAMLPPFPPSSPQNEATLYLTLNFILIRHGG